MNKQVVVCMYNGILFSNKKEWRTNTCHKMNEPLQHYVKWEKPDPKGHILYGSVVFTWNCLKYANTERERAVWWMLGDEASREERETAYWVKAFTLTFFQGWGMPCGLQILVSQPKIESTEWKYGALTPGLPGISLKGFTMVWWKYSRTI